MAKRATVRCPTIAVPQTLGEAATFVRQIGQEQRAIETLQATLTERVEQLKAETQGEVSRHEAQLSELVEGLFGFAQSHRETLIDHDRKKTVDLPTGGNH